MKHELNPVDKVILVRNEKKSDKQDLFPALPYGKEEVKS
jgi:hypothetical protein